jgi:hypothetical protein
MQQDPNNAAGTALPAPKYSTSLDPYFQYRHTPIHTQYYEHARVQSTRLLHTYYYYSIVRA